MCFNFVLVRHLVYSYVTMVTGYYQPIDNTTALDTVPSGPPHSGGSISLAVSSLLGVASATVIIVGTLLGIGRLVKYFNQVRLY